MNTTGHWRISIVTNFIYPMQRKSTKKSVMTFLALSTWVWQCSKYIPCNLRLWTAALRPEPSRHHSVRETDPTVQWKPVALHPNLSRIYVLFLCSNLSTFLIPGELRQQRDIKRRWIIRERWGNYKLLIYWHFENMGQNRIHGLVQGHERRLWRTGKDMGRGCEFAAGTCIIIIIIIIITYI
jgi:hypothetical protein